MKKIISFLKRMLTISNESMIKILETQGYSISKISNIKRDHCKSLKGKKIE